VAAETGTASRHLRLRRCRRAAAAELTERAVYGLPELECGSHTVGRAGRESRLLRDLVILALAPLLSARIVDADRGIISDSKSGVSGAGKEPTARTHFVRWPTIFPPTRSSAHRHTGEILEQLALNSGS
jgi:N-acetyl-gamma-glutamyl-phosphate reductase